MVTALLYPLLFSLAIPLALAEQNLDQGIGPSDVVVPLVLAVCFAVIADLMSRALSSKPHQRAVVAASIVAVMYLPGIAGRHFPGAVPAHLSSLLFLLAAVLLAPAVGFVTAKSRIGSRELSRFMFFLSLILCVYQGTQLISRWVRPSDLPSARVPMPASFDAADPDIWLIVLDAYTSPMVLRNSYNLNIAGFLTELEKRGFQVPANARSNYVNTVLSLASFLNRRYLDSATDGFSEDGETLQEGATLLENNETVRDLRERGYEFVFFRSSFPRLAQNRLADLQVPDRLTGEFTLYWVNQTLLGSATAVYCWLAPCLDDQFIAQAEGATEVDRKAALLTNLARRREGRPRFVFVHFLLPHGPMRLTASCEARDPVWPTTPQEAASYHLRALYADQVQCTNDKVLALADSLLAVSNIPPVILLQGDHGYGRFQRGRTPALSAASREQVGDRISVFGAYYLPDGDRSEPQFWDGITPVNVMRVVMTALFGEPFTPLPDRTYWSDWDHPYSFEEVTEFDLADN